METSNSLVLQHKETKLFISYAPDSYHTKNLKQARRFKDTEQLVAFMTVSCYAPDEPDDYEAVAIKITYELEVESSE